MKPDIKSAVVTGVSTGIGRAITDYLIAEDWHVFGSVRKEEDARSLWVKHKELFTPLVFDVTDPQAVARGAEQVARELDGSRLHGLVNNAGIALGGPLAPMPLARLKQQFDVNVFGVHAVTQAFLPLLGAGLPKPSDPGRIIMMSSVAGRLPVAFNGIYAASKHALRAYGDALRQELQLYGIDVVQIEPGPVKSEIWAKAKTMDTTPFEGSDYWRYMEKFPKLIDAYESRALPASEVARRVHWGLTKPKPKTRYVVTSNRWIMFDLPRLMPDRVFDKALAKRIKF